MNFKTVELLLLILGFLFVIPTQVACTTTLGAPEGEDAFDAESPGQLIENIKSVEARPLRQIDESIKQLVEMGLPRE